MRVLLALLLSLLALGPTAAAANDSATVPLGDPWGPLRAWHARTAVQETIVLSVAGFNTGYLDLQALGDVDDDGRAEVLLVEQEAFDDLEDIPRVRATVLKPMQDETVWSREAAEGGFLEAIWDLQDDKVRDVIAFTFGDGTIRFQNHVPAPVPVYAYDVAFAFNSTADFWSGRDAASLGSLEDVYASSGTDVGAWAPLAGASVAQGLDTGVTWSFADATTVLVADVRVNVTSAFAYAAVTGQWVDAQDVDGTFTLRTLDGQPLASRTVAGPLLTPVAVAGLGSDDGQPRLAVAWTEGPQMVQLGVPADPATLHVEVTGGGSDWGFETDLLPAVEVEMIGLPDLTGDGVGELEVVVYSLDVQVLGESFGTSVRDGATGTVLGSVESTDASLYFVPFGDLDGDAVPELLQVRFGLDDFSLQIGPTKADLKPLWTMDLDDEFPINFMGDELGVMGGFADWSGDGAADLALVNEDRLRLVDGTTGQTLWQRDLEDDQWVWPLGEATGAGEGDFALTWVTGVEEVDDGFPDGSKAVVGYAIGAGETSAILRTQTMRDPAAIPAGPAGSEVAVVNVGDVDGDGRDEFGVIVSDLAVDTLTWGDENVEYLRGTPSAHIFTLGRSDALWSRAAPTRGNATGDLPAATIVDSARAPPGEAPGLPLAIALLALTVMAGLRRRR